MMVPDMKDAMMAGDALLLEEQASLLRQCRAALDQLLNKKPMLGAMEYQCGHMRNSLGNLCASMFDYRPSGVFGEHK